MYIHYLDSMSAYVSQSFPISLKDGSNPHSIATAVTFFHTFDKYKLSSTFFERRLIFIISTKKIIKIFLLSNVPPINRRQIFSYIFILQINELMQSLMNYYTRPLKTRPFIGMISNQIVIRKSTEMRFSHGDHGSRQRSRGRVRLDYI